MNVRSKLNRVSYRSILCRQQNPVKLSLCRNLHKFTRLVFPRKFRRERSSAILASSRGSNICQISASNLIALKSALAFNRRLTSRDIVSLERKCRVCGTLKTALLAGRTAFTPFIYPVRVYIACIRACKSLRIYGAHIKAKPRPKSRSRILRSPYFPSTCFHLVDVLLCLAKLCRVFVDNRRFYFSARRPYFGKPRADRFIGDNVASTVQTDNSFRKKVGEKCF